MNNALDAIKIVWVGLMFLIGLVERKGEGEAKKAEVIAAATKAVNDLQIPSWAKTLILAVLPFAIDRLVAWMKANGVFEKLEGFLTQLGIS